jgi:hypothetical protein
VKIFYVFLKKHKDYNWIAETTQKKKQKHSIPDYSNEYYSIQNLTMAF